MGTLPRHTTQLTSQDHAGDWDVVGNTCVQRYHAAIPMQETMSNQPLEASVPCLLQSLTILRFTVTAAGHGNKDSSGSIFTSIWLDQTHGWCGKGRLRSLSQ